MKISILLTLLMIVEGCTDSTEMYRSLARDLQHVSEATRNMSKELHASIAYGHAKEPGTLLPYFDRSDRIREAVETFTQKLYNLDSQQEELESDHLIALHNDALETIKAEFTDTGNIFNSGLLEKLDTIKTLDLEAINGPYDYMRNVVYHSVVTFEMQAQSVLLAHARMTSFNCFPDFTIQVETEKDTPNASVSLRLKNLLLAKTGEQNILILADSVKFRKRLIKYLPEARFDPTFGWLRFDSIRNGEYEVYGKVLLKDRWGGVDTFKFENSFIYP